MLNCRVVVSPFLSHAQLHLANADVQTTEALWTTCMPTLIITISFGDPNAGLDRTPEQAQLVFECLSKICRDLCRQLSADLPATLKATTGLRYSHAGYVRGLAAQAVGLLFRHAGNTAHKRGLMALYAGRARGLLRVRVGV